MEVFEPAFATMSKRSLAAHFGAPTIMFSCTL
jgi:hypothetical protein